MKKNFVLAACLLSLFIPLTVFAANVTKVVITAVEPMVGERQSYEASVPATASTEIYEVLWNGEFDNGVFVQGRDYTMTVKLRIKASSSNVFSTTSNINVTINGHKAKVTKISEKYITVKYTWKTLGGENPDSPEYKLKARLKELTDSYKATNATDDKEFLQYLRKELVGAEVWVVSDGSYKYSRKLPSETVDGRFTMLIGLKHGGVSLDRYRISLVLPARNTSVHAQKLNEDMELMKKALDDYIVTAQTTGSEILNVVNAAAIHGSKAEWGENYTYEMPTSSVLGSIDGNLIIALGDKKDYIRAHKVLPIKGDAADADIDADFITFSKALHNYAVTNKTAKEELMKVANAAITNGSKLSCTGFEVNKATYENEGKIVMYFELTNKDKRRSPRIMMKIPVLKAVIPPGLPLTIQEEWEVARQTNIRRYKFGLPLLAIATPLQEAAEIRADELFIKCCHTRPNGTNYNTAIDTDFSAGKIVGENINAHADSPTESVNKWMDSPGHRANILESRYCYIGVGRKANSVTKSWVQLFAGNCDVSGVESSTGSFHFKSIEDMENAYVICEMLYKTKAYIPFDTDYMQQHDKTFTLRLKGKTITVTVDRL